MPQKPKMMKNFLFSILLILFSCQKENVNEYSVEIYGNDNCAYTTSLRNECTKLNLDFQYFSVSNEDNHKKASDLVSKFSLGQISTITIYVDNVPQQSKSVSFNYPIVQVKYNNETFGLERPSIETIKKIIQLK